MYIKGFILNFAQPPAVRLYLNNNAFTPNAIGESDGQPGGLREHGL